MADQDFNINIRTIADTTGITLTKTQLEAFNRSIAAGETQRVAAQLAAQNSYYDATSKSFKSLEAQQEAATPKQSHLLGPGRSLNLIAHAAIYAAGYELVRSFRAAANEIEKISGELDKQGAQIVENAQKFSEEAKFATSTADVIKIGEGALKGVEAAHKNLLDVSARELSVWQKIADIWAAGFKDKGPIAQALELQQAQAQQNYQMERNNAIHEITAAQRTKDNLATRGYAEKVEYLTGKIKEQEDTQKRVGVSNIEDYLKAGKEADNYRQILEGVNSERRKELAGAGDRTKQILKNEELAREARKYGREDQAAALDIGAQVLKQGATAQEMAEYKRLSGQEEAEALTRKRQEAIDRDLERQRSERNANYKTAEQIGRENADRAAAEANERAGRGKAAEPPAKPPATQPQAQPSAAPTPSPDVVQAIQNLEAKFDRYWS